MLTSLKKIKQFFDKRIASLAESFRFAPTFIAIRATFFTTLPLLFILSIAELYVSFPLLGYQEFMIRTFGQGWQDYAAPVITSLRWSFSPTLAFVVAYYLAVDFNSKHMSLFVHPTIASFVGLISYTCIMPFSNMGELLSLLSSIGIVLSVATSIVATRIFLFLYTIDQLRLHWPGTTMGLHITQSFTTFVPAILTISFVIFLNAAADYLFGQGLFIGFFHVLSVPFSSFDFRAENTILYVILVHILWFFGFHGGRILREIMGNTTINPDIPSVVAQAGDSTFVDVSQIINSTFFDSFVFSGGAGMGMSLVLALIFFGKTPSNRKLGLFLFIPCLFNMNEVLLFGIPIVLNPIMFIPFLLAPLISISISYSTMLLGLVPVASEQLVWSTPVFLNAYLATDSVAGVVLQVCMLILGVYIYAPFIQFANVAQNKHNQNMLKILMQRANAIGSDSRFMAYNDDAGAFARNLALEMGQDLKKNQGFYLMLQPQICAISGKVRSVESLLRWENNTYGAIPTPIVIAIAESSGIIKQLGLWIFDEACRISKDWKEKGLDDIIISVNVSGVQLENSLAPNFQKIMEKYNLARGTIELEVTESRMLTGSSNDTNELLDLHKSGFPLAIDDFGMGHSSLKYLRQFPVAVIKIDGAIIKDVLTNSICVDIVSTITKLCRARQMRCIAEFVETEKHAKFLQELGCDLFQGYLYSPPLLPDECYFYIVTRNARLEEEGIFKQDAQGDCSQEFIVPKTF